jgi:hypothetical protein
MQIEHRVRSKIDRFVISGIYPPSSAVTTAVGKKEDHLESLRPELARLTPSVNPSSRSNGFF